MLLKFFFFEEFGFKYSFLKIKNSAEMETLTEMKLTNMFQSSLVNEICKVNKRRINHFNYLRSSL